MAKPTWLGRNEMESKQERRKEKIGANHSCFPFFLINNSSFHSLKNKERRKAGKDESEAFLISSIPYSNFFCARTFGIRTRAFS